MPNGVAQTQGFTRPLRYTLLQGGELRCNCLHEPCSSGDVQYKSVQIRPCAVQCSAVQCSAVQCSAVQCSAVQCSDCSAPVPLGTEVSRCNSLPPNLPIMIKVEIYRNITSMVFILSMAPSPMFLLLFEMNCAVQCSAVQCSAVQRSFVPYVPRPRAVL
jgi:hypothetical protein